MPPIPPNNDQQLIDALTSLTTQLADSDKNIVDATTSLNKQLANLQSFLAAQNQRQTNTTQLPPALAAAGFQIPQAAIDRAVKLGLEGYAGPSMPTSVSGSGSGTNNAPSNPQAVADQVAEANTGNIAAISNVLAASQLAHGPQFYKNWTLGTYNWQKNILLAQQLGSNLNPALTYNPFTQQANSFENPNGFIKNTAGQILQRFTTPTGNIAIPTPFGTQTVTPQKLQFASTVANTVGHINDWFNTEATVGQTFGYGPGALGNAFMGFHVPQVGGAQKIGMGADALKNWLQGRSFGDLGGGSNVTSSQVQQMLDAIMNQGFGPSGSNTPVSTPGSSDAKTIAGSFMAPLMSRMPGLSADTLSQFTPALRNSATSATQLADALSNVDKQSQAAKETVNEFADSLVSASQSFANMGANLPAAIGTSMSFSQATGLDPQVAAQLAQNPLIQGMALGQGILPSALGNMGGAFTSVTEQTVKMLAGALSGLNNNRYETLNGQKFLVSNGQVNMDSQIASMLGIPETMVQRLRGTSNRAGRIANAEKWLGSPTGDSGLYYQYNALKNNNGEVTGGARETLQRHWDAMIPVLEHAGISQKHIRELTNDKNWRDRLKETNRLLGIRGGHNDYNHVVKQSVTVGLTPQAARILQVMNSTSDNKIINNAGGQTIRETKNQPTGDLSNKAARYGFTPDKIGPYGNPQSSQSQYESSIGIKTG